MTKISIVVFDLSSNPIVRAYPIAKILEKYFEVEVIGVCYGSEVNTAYVSEFRYKEVPGTSYPQFLVKLREVYDNISGDIIYAFKPRPMTFGLSLMKSLVGHRMLILDIEDWEIAPLLNLKTSFPRFFFHILRSFKHPDGWIYTALLDKMTGFADAITVVSTFLQHKYGGYILPHGADTDIFDPTLYDRDRIREQYGIKKYHRIVMFAGTIRPRKGVHKIAHILRKIDRKDILLLLVGAFENQEYERQVKSYDIPLVHIPPLPHAQMPAILSMADIVVLPSENSRVSQAQVPGKLFEAMAMGKAIVATAVSDIPTILDNSVLVVEPGNGSDLEEAMRTIIESNNVLFDLGEKARKRCLVNYSWRVMEDILKRVFHDVGVEIKQ